MDAKHPHPEHALLVAIGDELRKHHRPGEAWEIPATVASQLSLLDSIAHRTNRVYSIFDFSTFEYLYCSSNLATLMGEPRANNTGGKWDDRYYAVIQDRKSVAEFIEVRQQVLGALQPELRPGFVSSVCGGAIVNFRQQAMRLHYRSVPLAFDALGHVAVSFDYLEDIAPMLTSSAGYWMRFDANGQIVHWHSQSRRIVKKDIVSPREKNLIDLWRQGRSIAEIADLAFVNSQTVKNQLNNVRNRLFARDNTALVQLCTLCGVLEPTF